MILTVTMNPAVDRTVKIDKFSTDTVNLIREMRSDAGGKGINVSKIVKQLGGRTRSLAFLGGAGGRIIEAELAKRRIALTAIPIAGDTRTNTKIVDPVAGTYTDVNEPGPQISEAELDLFIQQLNKEMTAQTIVVITGSIPKGIPETIYRDLIEKIQRIGAKAVLDADRKLLKYGIQSSPYVIKPNIDELSRLMERNIETLEEVKEAARYLQGLGVKNVIVTLGEKGALFATEKAMYHGAGIPVQVLSTVGAGDALLGAFCYGMDKQLPLQETIKLSVASSAAMISVEGTSAPELEQIYRLMSRVEITELE